MTARSPLRRTLLIRPCCTVASISAGRGFSMNVTSTHHITPTILLLFSCTVYFICSCNVPAVLRLAFHSFSLSDRRSRWHLPASSRPLTFTVLIHQYISMITAGKGSRRVLLLTTFNHSFGVRRPPSPISPGSRGTLPIDGIHWSTTSDSQATCSSTEASYQPPLRSSKSCCWHIFSTSICLCQ